MCVVDGQKLVITRTKVHGVLKKIGMSLSHMDPAMSDTGGSSVSDSVLSKQLTAVEGVTSR